MLVVMQAHAHRRAGTCGLRENRIFRIPSARHPGAQRTAIGITGNQGAVEQSSIEEMPGVAEVIRVSKPYKLVSRDVKEEDTVIAFPGTDATIGGREAGRHGRTLLRSNPANRPSPSPNELPLPGAQFFRGGAYKPRTSPYAFQGLGEEALQDHGRDPRQVRPIASSPKPSTTRPSNWSRNTPT